MSSRRALIASALQASLLTATGINTVAFCNALEDLEYPYDLTVASTPAVKIFISDEDINYKPNTRSYNKIKVEMMLYIVEWSKTSITTVENILKSVRDVLGNNLSLTNTAVDISLTNLIKNKTEYPLISYRICGIIGYEESIKNV